MKILTLALATLATSASAEGWNTVASPWSLTAASLGSCTLELEAGELDLMIGGGGEYEGVWIALDSDVAGFGGELYVEVAIDDDYVELPMSASQSGTTLGVTVSRSDWAMIGEMLSAGSQVGFLYEDGPLGGDFMSLAGSRDAISQFNECL